MRHVVFAILIALGLPQMAAAGPFGVATAGILAQGAPLERAVPATPAPGVDLQFDGAPPRLPPDAPDGASGTEGEQAERGVATTPPSSDRGLSFGLELKQRSRFGALARKDDVEDPSLGNQLDKLIERPVFGLRGRYRF